MKLNLTLLLTVCYLMLSCSSQKSSSSKSTDTALIGVWLYEEKYQNVKHPITSTELTFNEDGTFNNYFKRFRDGEVDVDTSDDGTWWIQNGRLILDYNYIPKQTVYKYNIQNGNVLFTESIKDNKDYEYFRKEKIIFVKIL